MRREGTSKRTVGETTPGGCDVTEDIPADTGSADPSSELRSAAETVRERYRKGSPAYGFWRVTAGIWDRWAERMELGVELTPVSHAEYQAALFSARKYLELRHGGSEPVVAEGPLSCRACGQVFISPDDGPVSGTELSVRLLGHVCSQRAPGSNES
jgi:hypothetical protein